MKKVKLFFTTVIFCSILCINALAGEWKQEETGWRYLNDDGSYAQSSWQWIDASGDGIAKNYYFDASGYCLMGTTTPDGYTVDSSGAWVIDGVVQTKVLETASVTAVPSTQAETQAAVTQRTSWNANYPYVDGMTDDSADCKYVVNTNTGKVHKPSCSSVKDMKSKNTQYFNGNFSSLTDAGYSACGRCRAK